MNEDEASEKKTKLDEQREKPFEMQKKPNNIKADAG